MRKPKMTAQEQLAHEDARRAAHPIQARQSIAEQHDTPEFHSNRERLRAERLAREAEPK